MNSTRLNFIPRSLCALTALFLLSRAAPAGEALLGGDHIPTSDGNLIVLPINHATLALGWKNRTIYVDPVGGAARFASLPRADLILVTDIHGDHLNAPTIKALSTDKTLLVVPDAVSKQLPDDVKKRVVVLPNGGTTSDSGVSIEAVPMYNTTEERANYHAKGRGNGYVLTFANKRVYISGDTEDIPEMRSLKNIDVAFLCMNLPYTMTVDQAAAAVREFKPKIVYPYHYRGSDLNKFRTLVGYDLNVEVRIRDWYKP